MIALRILRPVESSRYKRLGPGSLLSLTSGSRWQVELVRDARAPDAPPIAYVAYDRQDEYGVLFLYAGKDAQVEEIE